MGRTPDLHRTQARIDPTDVTRTTLVFVDDQHQAEPIAADGDALSTHTVVAMTAEACEALERAGIDHLPVGRVADVRRLTTDVHDALMHQCWSLCTALDTRLREAWPRFAVDGPGLLTAQSYIIQYAMTALFTRFFLMREAVRALRPTACRFLPETINVWFAGQGYTENPWTTSLKEWLSAEGIAFHTAGARTDALGTHASAATVDPAAGSHNHAVKPLTAPRAPCDGFRLLTIDTAGYDWEPVVQRLVRDPTSQALLFESRTLHADPVPPVVHSRVRDLATGCWRLYERHTADDVPDRGDLVEPIERWCRQYDLFRPLGDVDARLWHALVPHLAHRGAQGCAAIALCDDLANDILDDFRPDAVGMIAAVTLFAKRLCWHCRQRGVPTILYQHGGSYGTCVDPPHELGGFQDCDYFLCYGRGIRRPDDAGWPLRSTFVPVGSSRNYASAPTGRIERDPGPCRALWIGGTSHQNTIAGFIAPEDTRRYHLVLRCLRAMAGRADLAVCYRPFPPTLGPATDGVRFRLGRDPIPGVTVDSTTPLAELMAGADVILTDIHCNTTWDEAAILGKPLILFCDPDQTALAEHFKPDVERTFCWCKTEAEMLDACRDLAANPSGLVGDLAQASPCDYVRRYVFADPGNPTDRVMKWLFDLKNGATSTVTRQTSSHTATAHRA